MTPKPKEERKISDRLGEIAVFLKHKQCAKLADELELLAFEVKRLEEI